MRRILSLVLAVLAALMLATLAAPVHEAAALCAPHPYAGQWESEGAPSLVVSMGIIPTCVDTFGRGIGGGPNLRSILKKPLRVLFHIQSTLKPFTPVSAVLIVLS